MPIGHDIAASKMKPSQSYYMESLFRERKRLHIDPSKEEKAAYMQGDEEEMPGMKRCRTVYAGRWQKMAIHCWT